MSAMAIGSVGTVLRKLSQELNNFAIITLYGNQPSTVSGDQCMFSNKPFGKRTTAIIFLFGRFVLLLKMHRAMLQRYSRFTGFIFLSGSRCKMVDLGTDCALFKVMSR